MTSLNPRRRRSRTCVTTVLCLPTSSGLARNSPCSMPPNRFVVSHLPTYQGSSRQLGMVLIAVKSAVRQKPCGLLNVRGFFDGLLSFIDHSIDERFVRRENRA